MIQNIIPANYNSNTLLFFIVVLAISLIWILIKYIYTFLNSKNIETDFTKIINHTFRTPLTRTLWLLQEITKAQDKNERDIYIKDVQNSTEKLLTIVDTFLGIKDINNMSGYVFRAVSLREIVETSLDKLSTEIKQKNITVNVPLFEDVPLLTVDLKKISFVINAVIENAVTYSLPNQSIEITCKVLNNKIIFSVADAGLGISIIEQGKIFKKFYRSKRAQKIHPDGLGLSLYLSKIIIKRHHGKIYAYSQGANKGATFYIEIKLNNKI